MACESSDLTQYFLQKQDSCGVYKGELMMLKQPYPKGADRQHWTKDELWGGSRREYQSEKLSDDWMW